LLNYNSKSSANIDGKQVRPKRGQYRKYESEQLAKAVAAVLSNEMSVHKAGSYFGVPHSTVRTKQNQNFKIEICYFSHLVGIQSQRTKCKSQ